MMKTFPLETVAQGLNASDIPWGVFAGAAILAYGGTRPITDIDILIPTEAGSQVARHLPAARCSYRADGSVSDLNLPGIEVIAGLSHSLTFSLDAEMIARLQRGELLGVPILLLSIEDNLALKATLGRGIEVGKYDWEDAATLLALYTPDWAYLRERLQICAPARAELLLERLQQMAKKYK